MRRLAFLAVCAVSCGDNPPAVSPDARPAASFALSVSPDPIVEAPCGGCGPLTGQLWAVGTLTIRETAGVGGSVDQIAMRLHRGGQTIAEGSFAAAAITTLAGSNRVPAAGHLDVPMVGPHYDQALGGMMSTLTFTVSLTDDGGHTAQTTVDVTVQPMP